MDAKYLEFLGQYFLAAAKGRRRLDEMAAWLRQGVSGSDALTRMWLQFYGIGADHDSGGSDGNIRIDADVAVADFKKGFAELLELFGIVAERDYRDLKAKYERLQKKAALQQETIARLKRVLEEKGGSGDILAREFADMMTQQTAQFNDLMASMGDLLSTPAKKD